MKNHEGHVISGLVGRGIYTIDCITCDENIYDKTEDQKEQNDE